MNNNSDKILILILSNDGNKNSFYVDSATEASILVDQHQTTDNHMICVEMTDGETGCWTRTQRWDRHRYVAENNWFENDTDAFETLGKITQLHRNKKA